MMKRLIVSCLVSLTIIGCQQQLIGPEDSNRNNIVAEFVAEVEKFDSASLVRTSMNEDRAVVWSSGDQLAIFQGCSLADKYQVKEAFVGSTNATFSIVKDENGATDGDFSAGTEIEFDTNIAIYPYVSDLVCNPVYDGDEVSAYKITNISVPSVQTYSANSFPEGAFIMTAVTIGKKDHKLKFSNVGGTLKLQLTGTSTIKTIELQGNADEALSGNAIVTVYPDNSVPKITMASNASKTVTLDCGDGVQLNENTPTIFMIALPPTAFATGFTATITDIQGKVGLLTTNKANPVKRSSIKSMPTMTFVGTVPHKEGDYLDDQGNNLGQGAVIDGKIWAPVNVGALSMTQYGNYYGAASSNSACPEGWRLPRKEEAENLINNTQYATIDGVNGFWMSGSVASTDPAKAIFLPQSGYGCSYWTINGDKYTEQYAIKFAGTDKPKVGKLGANASYPVRCVKSDPAEEAQYEVTIDGLTWATRNVGAEKISDAGNYYRVSTTPWGCPKGWRLPTRNDMVALLYNNSQWAVENGVPGYWFSGTTPMSVASEKVFFPMVDRRYLGNDGTAFKDDYGYYVLSNKVSDSSYSDFYIMLFNESEFKIFTIDDEDGIPIRCVKGEYTGPSVNYSPNVNDTKVNIDGLVWSSVNLGANTIEEPGQKYTWSEALEACPEGWRLPTNTECEALVEHYSMDIFNNVAGMLFTGSSSNTYSDPAVFFLSGSYWLMSESNSPYYLRAQSIPIVSSTSRETAQFYVRCVKSAQ